MQNSVNILVQARLGSMRLPGKVMSDIDGTPMIELMIRRLKRAKTVDKIIVATSTDKKNDELECFLKKLDVEVFRGSENDVLDRFYQAAREHQADHFIRVTADCPLIDPELIDQIVSLHLRSGAAYTSNTLPPTYPDGLDVEVFTFDSLKLAWGKATEAYDREHVTPLLRRHAKIKRANYSHSSDLSQYRWTVDEQIDLDLVRLIYEHLGLDSKFSWLDVLNLVRENPRLGDINSSIPRNEGASMSNGQKLWKRAKHVIPGGNMLLSKRPEMFLPDQWPAYFSKAKGCSVWDLDGNEFIDMSIMGIGTNILGYGHSEVDAAVRETVSQGNMSTFNCPEEVYLAEKLVELHPWADMVRFARSGGEANSIAVRIARAARGKDKVAICGYHGWHDWYLAANLGDDKSLDGHLLPGLAPAGVPRNLAGTVFPFQYNNFEQLETIVKENDIGTIKMEVSRNEEPSNNFLQRVRKLATEKGIVLIFDECTSGFRETFGGLHKKYGVDPDIAMFGKALGNGYAITAIIGTRSVMEEAQSTFISSTFWTERIGPTAALATLKVMEEVEAWARITATGNVIRNGIKSLAGSHNLQIKQWGLAALTGYTFDSKNSLAYKTLVTQEMLKQGFLASNSTYVCTEHSPSIVDSYLSALNPIFGKIKECEDGRSISSLLDGPICHSGFVRLN